MQAEPTSQAPAEAAPASEPLTTAVRDEARQYTRAQLATGLVDQLVDVVFLAVMALVVARPLDAWLQTHGGWGAGLRLAAMYGATMLLHEVCSFPVACYGGYWLERRYGLSTQTFGHWLRQHLKRYALAVAFGAVLFGGLFALVAWCGAWWWLAGAAAFFVASVVIGQIAPVAILPLFYRIEPLDHPELAERMSRLAAGTGLRIDGLYRLDLSADTVKANAMLAGLGRTRRVLLGDTLLERFTLDELEVVLAHEIGHHAHAHLPKLLALGAVISAAGFWVCDRALQLWLGGSQFHREGLPVYALPALMLFLTLFSTIVGPLHNAISRVFERQSDRYALQKTGLTEAFVSAFWKLAQINKDDPDPPRWTVWLFHSHPPIAERVAMAREA